MNEFPYKLPIVIHIGNSIPLAQLVAEELTRIGVYIGRRTGEFATYTIPPHWIDGNVEFSVSVRVGRFVGHSNLSWYKEERPHATFMSAEYFLKHSNNTFKIHKHPLTSQFVPD